MGTGARSKRRVLPNPPAGVIRAREVQQGPWMQKTNQQMEAENVKAKGVLFEKRVFDIAKQAVASLQGTRDNRPLSQALAAEHLPHYR